MNKMGTGWPPKRAHNKPPRSRAALESALATHDKFMGIAAEIRARHNVADQAHWGEAGKHWCGWLDPEIPESSGVREWRERLAALGRPKVKAKPKAAPALTPAARLEAIAESRARRRREEEADDLALRELVASRALPARRIAERLGVSRQRIYQLA